MIISFLVMLFLDGGSLATPTAPQMTDANPNKWGEPMIRLKGMTINDDLKAGRGQI